MAAALDQKLIILVVVVIVIVVLAIILFNNKYKTQEERDANRHKLFVGIALGVLVAGGVYVLMEWQNMPKDSIPSASDSRQEHGVFDSAAENLRNYRDRWAAGRAAKKAGGSLEDQQLAKAKMKRLQADQKLAAKEVKAKEAQQNQAKREALLNP